MATGKDAAQEAIKKIIAEKAGGMVDFQKKLKEFKRKAGVLSTAGQELVRLKEEFNTLTAKERLIKVCGLAALVTIGWMMKPEEAEHYMKGHEDIAENETHEGSKAEEEQKEAKEEAEEAVANGEMTQEEYELNFDPNADEVVTRQMSSANMYAIRYYNEDKTVHASPNGLGQVCIAENAIPSTFILERSRALFKEGVGTFEFFKENVTKKLVPKNVKDPEERIRQAAVILSCCAIGRFQIVPHFHFKRLGWPTRGEEGLKAMYNFIRSTDRQIAVFKDIIEGQWNRYKDIGLVAVAYYAGEETADAYKKNPKASRFHHKQHGGHMSIHDYATKARNNFAKYKKDLPGLNSLDYAAIVMESNETGKGVIFDRAKEGHGISSMRIPEAYAGNEPKKKKKTLPKPEGTRALTNADVTPDIEKAAQLAHAQMEGKPDGTEVRRKINGKEYVFQRQTHYNRNPSGAPGVSAFEVEA
ncbi:hypothetical protein JXD20_02980 [Candidatus Peregrinibacteria bacterium]|nr:hypothetical protein [Candidatus Peregrinibacteria bacterium]